MATLTARQRLEAIVKKLDAIEHQAHAIREELVFVLESKPTTGQEAKRLLDQFVKAWNAKKLGQAYVVNGAKDINTFKRLITALGADEVRRRMQEFLASTSPFETEAGHSIGAFAGTINRLGRKGMSGFSLKAKVVGCKHSPRCTSDQAHTKLTLTESRQ